MNVAAFDLLAQTNMIVLPVDAFRSEPELLEDKKELLIALSMCDVEQGLDWETASPSLRKRVMQEHADKIPGIFNELERFAALLRSGKPVPEISRELWHYLAVPSSGLPPGTREVLWILLTRKESRNILEAYTHDKNRFFDWYSAQSDAVQKWIAQYLKAYYIPHANRK